MALSRYGAGLASGMCKDFRGQRTISAICAVRVVVGPPSCNEEAWGLRHGQGHQVVAMILESEFAVELHGRGIASDNFQVNCANAVQLRLLADKVERFAAPSSAAMGSD